MVLCKTAKVFPTDVFPYTVAGPDKVRPSKNFDNFFDCFNVITGLSKFSCFFYRPT